MAGVTPVNSMEDHGDSRPSFLGARPADWISAEEIQGCWYCCLVRLPTISAVERRRAEGPDVLWHEGCCFPLCCPYREAWDREFDSNTFVKRGKGDRLHYPSAGGPFMAGPAMTCRLCKCCVTQQPAAGVPLVACPELAGEWRPAEHTKWTRPHQANHSYTVERWDAMGRNAYVTGGALSKYAVVTIHARTPRQ